MKIIQKNTYSPAGIHLRAAVPGISREVLDRNPLPVALSGMYNKNSVFLVLILLSIALYSCDSESRQSSEAERTAGQEADDHMHSHDFSDLVERFESPERAQWQKPESVIASFGDLSGKTIVDIGAGTGYFAFPLLSTDARKVIAADIDQRFLDYMNERAESEPEAGRLEIRKIPADSPGLDDGEVDLALMVNVYHHIDERSEYVQKIYAGLAENGRFINVDFKEGDQPIGPPEHLKISLSDMVSEMEAAGFSVTVDSDTLPYQYIITGTR